MLSKPFIEKMFWFYPFLFAIHPALSSYNDFIDQIQFGYVMYAIVALVILCLALLAFFWSITKDIKKSRISIAFFFVFTFSYNVINAIFPETRTGIILSFMLLCIILSIIFYLIYKKVKDTYILELTISIVGVMLIIIVLFGIVNYKFLDSSKSDYSWQLSDQEIMDMVDMGKKVKPNIYFIVLDGYARHDVLLDVYNCDNAQFIDFLGEKGFYVVERSASNYSQTRLYLASLLNMDYIASLTDLDSDSSALKPVIELIEHNNVLNIFDRLGYKTVFISSNSQVVDFIDSDHNKSYIFNQNVFNQVFLMKTPVPYLFSDLKYNFHRNSVEYAFASLPDRIKNIKEPAFIFTHILSPHPPFVFDKDGNKTRPDRYYTALEGTAWDRIGGTRGEYIEGYRGQLKYINRRTEQLISEIFNKTEEPFIIILQSDHGPSSEFDWSNVNDDFLFERLSNLYAIYYSDQDYQDLYDTMTPVNTFRLIFNKYFGSDMNILEDKSFFSTYEQPYNFIETDVNKIFDRNE